jgi:4-diphosphocytidyl-2-C-methyl-D-erythritol kinase
MTKPWPSLTLSAPAKINLRLEVLGRRPDGYHELCMVNAPVDLYDTVRLQLARSGIRVSCSDPGVPTDRTNLAARAAELLLQRRPEPRPGVRIRIWKRIPVAAGLGGGSSDAAATLVGLNRLLRMRLSAPELARLALRIGADVPFFLEGRPALVQGIGEKLKRIPRLPDWTYLLVFPPFGVSTAWAFAHWRAPLTKPVRPHIMMLSKNPDRRELSHWLRNDLETPVVRRYPLVKELKRMLVSLGALGAVMSGSGSTVVGVFQNRHQAGRAGRGLRQCFPACRVVAARGLLGT